MGFLANYLIMKYVSIQTFTIYEQSIIVKK